MNLEYLRNVILQFLEHKEMRVRRRRIDSKTQLDKFFQAGSSSRVVDNSSIHATGNPPAYRKSMSVRPQLGHITYLTPALMYFYTPAIFV